MVVVGVAVVVVVYLSVYLQARKRSYSARPLQFLTLATSKTQQFSETSSMFELDNVTKRRNSARLPQFLKLTTSKTKQCWETSFKHGKLSASAFCNFSLHLCKVLRLPRKSEARSYEVLHLSRKIILANLKIRCSKMQPLSRKSAP